MGRPPKHQSTPTGRAAVNAALLLTLCGLAAPGLAQNWHWSGAMGDDWSVPFNWLPNGLPPEASHVRIGSLANVENATVHLDMPDTVGALTITDGMSLSTGSRSLAVLGDASISGRNIVDFGGFDVAYASTLDVGPVDGNSFGADDLTLSDGGTFRLRNQAYTRVAGRVTVGVDTGVRGNGTLTLQGAGVTLVNDGIIDPGTEGSLRLQQIGGGLYDLDGTSGAGKLGLGVYDTIDDRGPRLRIDGTALSDGFSGEIQMTSESELAMNLSDGWAADSNSSIWIAGAYEQEGGPAVIRGGEFEFAGELDVTGQEWGRLRVEPERFILRSEARVTLANETQADFGADAGTEVLIRGGEFNIGANAVLRLNGSTKWDGDVLATGVVRQMDEASVTGPSVIDAEVIDLDGDGDAAWSITNQLVIHAGEIDTSPGQRFDGLIDIGGGFLPHLALNLSDPAARWVVAGELELSGDPSITLSRVSGSPLEIVGTLDIVSGKVAIASNLTLAETSTTKLASAATLLRLDGRASVQRGAAFLGQGTIQIATSGRLTLDHLADLGDVSLQSRGLLRIGAGAPAQASVMRFDSTHEATLHLEIGGHAPGSEHDTLAVGGDVRLDGAIDVDLIDAGDGAFLPQAGDMFTIISAGGVSGEFLVDPISIAGGNIYEWKVVYGLKRVGLEVAAVFECVGDFNGDGVVNTIDLIDFLNAWNAQDAAADMNRDGDINTLDVVAFLNLWSAGC